MNTRAAASCLLLSLSVSACYQYFPVRDTEPLPRPRAEVRMRLDEPVSLETGSQTLHHVNGVEGDVFRSSGDTLAIFSRWLRTAYGYRQPMSGEVFFFDRWQFAGLEERRFVPVKSAIAVAAVAGGVVAVFDWAIGLGGGSESSGPGGGDVFNIRVPIPLGVVIDR